MKIKARLKEDEAYPFWSLDCDDDYGYEVELTPDELILYMPDYPVARDTPIDFTTAAWIWSMTGGVVQPRIPLSALAPALHI